MRRLAFISDVHSNLEALTTVMNVIEGAEVFCLGDVVGYGANPNEVVEVLMDAKAKVLMGNHDSAAVTGDVGGFNARAALAAVWTRERLTRENLAFLSALPLRLVEEVEGAKLYAVHGSPDDPLREYVDPRTHAELFSHYLQKTNSHVISLGHTHVPFAWTGEGGTVFNPGSVGQPRDGDPRASFALATFEHGRAEVELKRVEYDVGTASRKIIEAGLPKQLSERILVGF